MITAGDCVEVMAGMDAASVDAVVTDPPYGIGFMGKDWDIHKGDARDWGTMGGPTGRDNTTHSERGGAMHAGKYDLSLPANRGFQAWCELWAREAFRVLKPGGHLLAFGGTRTYHRLACAVEDAGFEIRDTIAWWYGSGFPKSLDVAKAIDRMAGAQWDGWGTALKPAHEPVVVARKPLAGTVAGNVLEHGTGALNIDGCRVEGTVPSTTHGVTAGDHIHQLKGRPLSAFTPNAAGRWPANVVLSHTEDCVQTGTRQVASDGHHPAARGKGGLGTSGHSGQDGLAERYAKGETVAAWDCAPGCPVRLLDEQTGERGGGFGIRGGGTDGHWNPTDRATHRGQTIRGGGELVGYGDSGGASRFFYTAKASRAERNAGLDGFEASVVHDGRQTPIDNPYLRAEAERRNTHPTVKPVALMRWLVRLVTPPGGLVLDPFAGSGTTGIACALEGFRFHGIERDEEYAAIARARIRFWLEHGEDGLRIVAERDRAEAKRQEIAAAGQLDLLGGVV